MKTFREAYEFGTDEYTKHTKKKTPGQNVKEESDMRVFRVTSSNMQGNVHAKDRQDAIKKAQARGMKGSIQVTDRGPVKNMPRARPIRSSVEEGTNMFTDDRVGFQIDRFAMGKGKRGFQINYGRERGRYIQVPEEDMKRVIAQMTKAMKAK